MATARNDDLVTQNRDDIFQILNAVRLSSFNNDALNLLTQFAVRNTSENANLQCRNNEYTRFMVRLFDVAGRVWELDSWDNPPRLQMNDFQFEKDKRVASWWDPRRKDPSSTHSMPVEFEHNALCIALSHYELTNTRSSLKHVISISKDGVESLKDETLFKQWIEADETALKQWRNYLNSIIGLSSESQRMDAERMASIFWGSLSQNKKDAEAKRMKLERSFAYVFPCITANEVSCLITLRTCEPLANDDLSELKNTILPHFSNLSLLLSARIIKAHVNDSRQSLAHTYARTQSEVVWAKKGDQGSDWYDEPSVKKCFSDLALLRKELTDGLTIPIGDREIARAIRDRFLTETLKKVLPSSSEVRLEQILKTALDDEEVLRGIPRYRQHFIHSFHVFLTGLRFLVERPMNLSPTPLESLAVKLKLPKAEVLKAWFCASIFHDISYSVANVEEWVGFFLDRVILQPDKDNKGKLREQWVLHQIARLFRFENYQDSFTRLVEIMAAYSGVQGADTAKLSNGAYTMLLGKKKEETSTKSDHGILSALMFLNAFERNELGEPYIRLAADAIAYHNAPLATLEYLRDKQSLRQQFFKKIDDAKRNPLRDLLIICDQIQQWGRTESEASLAIFDIWLKDWQWNQLSSGNKSLTITLGYKSPIEHVRRKEEKAKEFYTKTWLNGGEGVYDQIKELGSAIRSPWGNIKIIYEFDSDYLGMTGSTYNEVEFSET